MFSSMKRIAAPFLMCLVLAVAIAVGGFSKGTASGMAAYAASLSPIVICSDGSSAKTVLIARDGTPVELPHCAGPLCEDCLQSGSVAILTSTLPPSCPSQSGAADSLHADTLHCLSAMTTPRNRSPPVGGIAA